MKFNYDPSYRPPVPVVEIRIGAPEEAFTVGPLLAIVDTGADGTLIPVQLIRQLSSLPAVNRKTLRSQWGEARVVRTYWVDLEVAGIRLPAIEIIADTLSDEVILGRNVLNRLKLFLDGPRTMLDVTD